MSQNQFLEGISNLIEAGVEVFNTENEVTSKEGLLPDGSYPITNNKWYKIPEVVCVFVDIRNSTALSAATHDKSTSSIYELFTGTAVKMFHYFDAGYIDIKGDGVFALYNKEQVHIAFAAAVTFKTFAETTFLPLVRGKLPKSVDIGCHMGIDQKTVLVKQIGIRDSEGRDRRKNEVWAGKPLNMAAKLAATSKDGELLVSYRYYNSLSDSDLVQKSCGCNGGAKAIWDELHTSPEQPFDFVKYYRLKTKWCEKHGKEWCEQILELDNQ